MRERAGKVRFCQTMVMLMFCVSSCCHFTNHTVSILNFMLRLCFCYGLVRLRHKEHLVSPLQIMLKCSHEPQLLAWQHFCPSLHHRHPDLLLWKSDHKHVLWTWYDKCQCGTYHTYAFGRSHGLQFANCLFVVLCKKLFFFLNSHVCVYA